MRPGAHRNSHGKKPTWIDKILNDRDCMAAEDRRKLFSKKFTEHMEARLKSMGYSKTTREKIIKQALKDDA